MPLSNVYNFLKYHPIFLRNILNRRTYICPHLHIKIYLVFHPLPSKIPYPKHPRGSYRKTYSTFKNYDARNATLKHIQLFEISSYLSTEHLKLTSLHLSSSPYKNMFSFSSPSIKNSVLTSVNIYYRRYPQIENETFKTTRLTCHFQTSTIFPNIILSFCETS